MTDLYETGTLAAFLKSRMSVVKATDDGADAKHAIARYCDLVNDAIDNRGYGASLFRVSPAILRNSSALIYTLFDREDGKLVCALHTAVDPDGKFIWINGVVKAQGEASPHVHELLARVIVDLELGFGANVILRACYRLFPDGFQDQAGRMRRENDGSARLFGNLEFRVIGIERITIEGTEQDVHLRKYAEADGTSFLTKLVESTPLTFFTARELVLAQTSKSGTA